MRNPLAIMTNEVEASPSGAEIHLTSSPTAQGVSPEVYDKLFTPYFTTTSSGVGLGLTMAKKVVCAHGGTIAVESELGVGTQMMIHLPGRVVTDGNNFSG